MKKCITVILNVLPVVFATMLLASCGGDGDNTVENWFIAILVILAMLKKG